MDRFSLPRFLSFLSMVLIAGGLFAQEPEPAPSERVLLPILTPPVHGAFGSEFHTDLRIANDSENVVFLLGLDSRACPSLCLPTPTLFPLTLEPNQEVGPEDITLNGTPGRFVLIPTDQVSSVTMNLRVHDVTRDGSNYGTEIPIVRESEFRTNKITFVGVPTDARFRNTLRIYGESPVDVKVTIGDLPPVRMRLTGGFNFPGGIDLSDFFEPAYASFSSFPTGIAPVRVTVETEPDFIPLLPIEIPLWAFITVTNNDTQVISTITPQP
jgi:hypothetical protein